MRHIPPNQMQMQPYDDIAGPNWPAPQEPTDYLQAGRRARRAVALIVVGLLAICGAIATAPHVPQLAAFTKHAVRVS